MNLKLILLKHNKNKKYLNFQIYFFFTKSSLTFPQCENMFQKSTKSDWKYESYSILLMCLFLLFK